MSGKTIYSLRLNIEFPQKMSHQSPKIGNFVKSTPDPA